MKIKFKWAARTSNPKEITDITLDQAHIPKKGELVEIEIQIEKNQWIRKAGRVLDVKHYIKRDSSVTVFLG